MTVSLRMLLVSLLLTLIAVHPGQHQQQCSVDGLPEFGDTTNDRPDHDRFQAIVPAYEFQCSGKVTEWRACVQPGGGMGREHYYIQFQVWRPTGAHDGCYSLVDYNIPLHHAVEEERNNISSSTNIIEAEGFLNPPDEGLSHCVVLPVRENKQIEVRPGDVVGYYVDRFRRENDGTNEDRTDGGIQWTENSVVTVYHYESPLPQADIKSHYAVNGMDPTSCGFGISEAEAISYSLASTPTSAPIISLSITPIPSAQLKSSARLPSPSTSPSQVLTSTVPSTLVSNTQSTQTNSVPAPPQSVEPSPPSASGTEDNTSTIIAIVFIIITVALVLAVVGIIIVVVIRRKKNRTLTAPKPLDNPAYMDTAGQFSLAVTNGLESSTASAAPQYDYCGVSATGGADETVYASLDDEEYHAVDYTTIYADPTSPSYVSEVYSSGSVFDTAGTCVPTLEDRSRYKSAARPPPAPAHEEYNTLQFFEREAVYWAPASTTLHLYQQLCSKRYREINRNQIRILEEIGSGQFGMVSKGVWKYRSETMSVAVKILTHTASEAERVKFLQEAAIMGQFYHPNIVRLHGVVTVGDPVMIVLDFMPNRDMKSYLDHLVIRSNDQAYLPRKFLKFCREIAAGMAYLAKKSFVHRDLAARNILLDDHMSCKVGDFGMARDLMDDTYYKSQGGKIPVKWTAPEALLYKKYSTPSDVWSYAMVLYEIWSVGKKPFQELVNSDVVARLQNRQCLAPPPGCPRQVYSLMVDCWNPEPQLRPSFDAVFRVLRRPEGELLHWSEEDMAAGRHLLRGSNTTHSFSDLQNKYT